MKLTANGTTHDGKGVCRLNGKAVFVKGLILGETAECEILSEGKSFNTARIISIDNPSKERIKPDCSCYEACGGCSFRHTSYEMELSLKKKRVEDAFEKIARISISNLIIHPSLNQLRNKVTFQFNGENFGFFAEKSHSLTCVEDCKIIHPVMFNIANTLSKHIKQNGIKGIRSLAVRVNQNLSEISVALEGENSNYDLSPLPKKFPEICAVTVNGKNIYGKGYITDTLCRNTLKISPQSFYQINPPQAQKAYNIALAMSGLKKEDTALDLCCGIGSITLFLARHCKMVYGAEIVPEAISNANENAKINGITNARFSLNDASKALAEYKKKGIKPNVIFVDPPRAGLDMSCKKAIAEFSPKKIVYISCDCATQARDVAFFKEQGYTLSQIEAVDFFPRTSHIETVCLLKKQGSKVK